MHLIYFVIFGGAKPSLFARILRTITLYVEYVTFTGQPFAFAETETIESPQRLCEEVGLRRRSLHASCERRQRQIRVCFSSELEARDNHPLEIFLIETDVEVHYDTSMIGTYMNDALCPVDTYLKD